MTPQGADLIRLSAPKERADTPTVTMNRVSPTTNEPLLVIRAAASHLLASLALLLLSAVAAFGAVEENDQILPRVPNAALIGVALIVGSFSGWVFLRTLACWRRGWILVVDVNRICHTAGRAPRRAACRPVSEVMQASVSTTTGPSSYIEVALRFTDERSLVLRAPTRSATGVLSDASQGRWCWDPQMNEWTASSNDCK